MERRKKDRPGIKGFTRDKNRFVLKAVEKLKERIFSDQEFLKCQNTKNQKE